MRQAIIVYPGRQDGPPTERGPAYGSLESRFDIEFTASLAQKEKQIQQNYRPIIGIHKWFARRPGTVFRNLLLAEFNGENSLQEDYWRAHQFNGVIADPFMGGGTPILEANRLGFSIVGADINPMAFWIVRQSLASSRSGCFRTECRGGNPRFRAGNRLFICHHVQILWWICGRQILPLGENPNLSGMRSRKRSFSRLFAG